MRLWRAIDYFNILLIHEIERELIYEVLQVFWNRGSIKMVDHISKSNHSKRFSIKKRRYWAVHSYTHHTLPLADTSVEVTVRKNAESQSLQISITFQIPDVIATTTFFHSLTTYIYRYVTSQLLVFDVNPGHALIHVSMHERANRRHARMTYMLHILDALLNSFGLRIYQ